MTPRARVEIGSGFGCVYVVTADGTHLSQVMPHQIAEVLREELAKGAPAQAPRVDPPLSVSELMHVALAAVHSFARPENWNDPEDPEQAEAWTLVDAAMLAYKQSMEAAAPQPQAEPVGDVADEYARAFHDGWMACKRGDAEPPRPQAEPVGEWVMVPREATRAMLAAARKKAREGYDLEGAWPAMLAAALNAQAGVVEALPALLEEMDTLVSDYEKYEKGDPKVPFSTLRHSLLNALQHYVDARAALAAANAKRYAKGVDRD